MPTTRPAGNPHRILLRAGLLLLGLVAAIPATTSAAAPTATIDTCFAPESDCAAFAVRAIDHAQREILVGAYGLTTGAGIVEALLRAHRRGVDVELIADKTTPCGRNSGIDPLTSAGVPVWIDHSARIAHAKTMVIDGTVTLNGSYKLDAWRRGKFRRSEPRCLACGRRGLRGSLARSPSPLIAFRSPRRLVPRRGSLTS